MMRLRRSRVICLPPVKYSPAMRHATAHLEDEVSQEMVGLLPPALRPALSGLIDHHEWPEHEARLVKSADRLAAWLKCRAELRYGNREFEQAEQQVKGKIEQHMTPEVEYFLKTFGPAYDLTLDSLMQERPDAIQRGTVMARWPDLALGRPTGRDVLAGLSLAGLLLPEAVAYAGLGNMPPQAGIVALFVGLLAYGLLGCSRFAIVSATSSSAALLAAVGSMSLGHIDWRVSLSAGLVGVAGGLFCSVPWRASGRPRPSWQTGGQGLYLWVGPAHHHSPVARRAVGSHGGQRPGGRAVADLGGRGHWHGPSFLVGALATALFTLSRHLRWLPAGLVVMAAGIAAQGMDAPGGSGRAGGGQYCL